MSENKIKFPVKLASNNPKSFGIVDATEVSGHRSVYTLSGLYSISDKILSILKDGSDAIGQEWFVVSEDCKYRLDNWENRKSAAGWTKLPKQELVNTKQSVSEKDRPSGYAGLDSNGKIPIEKIYGATPTIVTVETYESLPATGLDGVIYYVSNTGAQYKWSGSAYIEITQGEDNAKKNETSIFDCSNGTSTKYYSSLSNAINVVPPAYRTSNRIISYLSTENSTTSAVNYQYHGIDSTTWTDLTKWERIPNQTDLAEIRSDLSKLNSVVNGGTYPLFTMQGNGTDIYIPLADFEREESSFHVTIKVTNPSANFAQYGIGLSVGGSTYTYKNVEWDDVSNGIGHVGVLSNTTHLVVTNTVKQGTSISFYSKEIEGAIPSINTNKSELISVRSDLNEKNYYALKAPQSITEEGGGYYPYKFQHGLTYRVIISGEFIEEAYLAINYTTPQVQKINFYNGISIFTCNNSSISYINTLGISGISFEVEIVEPIATSLNEVFAKKYIEYIGNELNQHIPLTTFGLTSPTRLLFKAIYSPPNFSTVGLASSDGESLILYLPVTWIEYDSVNRNGIGYVNVPSGISHIAISSANTAYTHIFFYTATTSILLYQEIERAKLAEQSILNNIQGIEEKLSINNYVSQSLVTVVNQGGGYYPYPFLLNKHYRITISDGTLSGDIYLAKSALEPRVQQLIFFDGVCFLKCNFSGCNHIYASQMPSAQFEVEEMSSYDDIISKKVELPSDGYGLAGKILQTNGDGTTNWSEVGSPTDSQVDNAVNGWFLENQEKVLGIESIRELNSQKYHNNGCIVSFIDDDTSQYVGDIWGEILSSTNIKMGFACVTGIMGGSVTPPAVLTPMPLVDLKSLYDSGHDVYSHSHSHPAFYSDTTTVEMVDDECRLSKQWLDLNGFTRTSDIIVYPGGLGQSRVSKKDAVRKYFRYGVDTVGNGINPEPLDNWCVYRQNADTADLETLKAKVDEAYNANGLLVFMNHSYELYNGASGRTRDEEVAKMIALIEYIKGKGIQILPLSEALYRKGNIIAQGEYTQSDAYFVSKTGKKTGAGSSFIRESDIVNIAPLVGTSYSAYGGCYYYVLNNKIHFHFGLSGLTPQANNRVYIVTSLGANFSPIRDVVATGKCGTSMYQGSICTISTTGAVDISSFDSYAEIDIEYPLKM